MSCPNVVTVYNTQVPVIAYWVKDWVDGSAILWPKDAHVVLCGNLPGIPQLPHPGIPSQPLLQCSTWSFPNSLKQLHKKQARTEQAGTLSLPYTPLEALLRSQRQRTAWFEQHSWTQVTHDFSKAHFPTELPWTPAYCKWQQVFQCQRNRISLETCGIQGDSGQCFVFPCSCQWMSAVQLCGQWLPSPAAALGSAL